MLEEKDWVHISVSQRPRLLHTSSSTDSENFPHRYQQEKELQLTLKLQGGLGISVVSRKPPEELLYAHLKDIILERICTSAQQVLNISIQDIQIDNQLFEASCPVLLYVTPPNRNDEQRHLPAIHITAERVPSPNINADIFKVMICNNFILLEFFKYSVDRFPLYRR